jgi:hypothetical protein
VTADDLGDVSERHALVADAVQPCACWCVFQGQSEEMCRIKLMHGWPPVGPVTDVGRDAFLARDIDKYGNEAVGVGRTVFPDFLAILCCIVPQYGSSAGSLMRNVIY